MHRDHRVIHHLQVLPRLRVAPEDKQVIPDACHNRRIELNLRNLIIEFFERWPLDLNPQFLALKNLPGVPGLPNPSQEVIPIHDGRRPNI